MTTLINKAGRELFSKHLEQYSPADPMYEEYTTAKGKKKRRKRAAPPGLSARDAKILKSVQRRAHYLDKGFKICGIRFGWTFLLGLIPMVGNIADAGLNYVLVVRKAQKAEIPDWLVRRMLMTNAVSAGVGFIPIAGDVVLAAFKANSRNAALLEEFLRIRGEEFVKAEESRKAGGSSRIGGGPANAQLMPKADAEQVKPGAGATTPAVDATEGTMPEPGPVQQKSKSMLRWRSAKAGSGKGKQPESPQEGNHSTGK
ncbi:hypothetical protein FIBSPDRAFT_914853 [Athelia psychrophila]|uniref:DUF4112 domain-containing protein n=1 Tax=Athelia psychrophila TaxID=1759441 RepID=A0A167W2C5_9AGAM|nr:hypothetical protein FIBSPDRAFT_914853 [Fibularhizoctonia sp. CBS 109695]